MPPHPLTPLQVATDYSFPPFTTGAGQTIALVELGGGFLASDNAATFATLGPAAPTPTVIVASGTNSPSADPTNRADQEVAMDIQIAGSCAPGATIALYFATDSSESEGTFIATVQTAVHDSVNNPSVISVSWGWPEEHFSAMAMQTMEDVFIDAAVMGITVCAASGDHGATGTDPPDGKGRVVFPASAPHALACGGTELAPPAETAWNEGAVPKGGASGGGISTAFAVPYYQVGMSMPPSINPGGGPGRGVPDVAGNAAAATGYRVTFHGFSTSASGTSTVAPLWAALIARLNEVLGHRLGFVNPMLYQLRGTPAFRDITVGNNDIAGSGAGYKAGAGWDCCTGLGSPVGTELLKALTFSKLSQFFAPNQITCGYAQDATLYLDKPDTVPITVAVTSDNPNVVKVVSPVTILPGNVSCPVTCAAPAVAGPFVPKFVEVHATYAGTTLTMTAEVVPPRVVSVALAPSTVLNGGSSQCTVSLDRASLKGKVTVELFCSAPGYASVPPTLQIDETDDHNRFTVTTPAIASPFPPAHATILAIYRASPTDPGTSASAVLTVEPNVVPGMVKSLALTPATVTEGGLSTGLVTLIQPVPTDTVVGLTARDLLANGTPTPPVLGGGSTIVSLPVPPAVTVYAGHTQAQFTIKTKPNSVAAGSIRRVQISAVTGFLPAIATLTVQH
jgi:subtilase family serine protease